MKFDYTMPEEPEQDIDDACPERWVYDDATDQVHCAACGCPENELHETGCVFAPK